MASYIHYFGWCHLYGHSHSGNRCGAPPSQGFDHGVNGEFDLYDEAGTVAAVFLLCLWFVGFFCGFVFVTLWFSRCCEKELLLPPALSQQLLMLVQLL